MDGQRYPNRIILGTETYPPEIARNWDCVLHMNHVIGDFTWAGWDYLGEAGVGIPGYVPGEGGFMADFPAQLPYVGDFDLTGRRRPASITGRLYSGCGQLILEKRPGTSTVTLQCEGTTSVIEL